MARAAAQEPQLVVVLGEPGVGKTTLVRHCLPGRAGSVDPLWASGEAGESALAYGVLAQLTGGPVAADPPAAGAALLDLLGERRQRARTAHGGPVVLVVDDAQWVDTPSLHALTFALRRLRADRVLTVIVARSLDDPALPEGLRRLCADDTALRLHLDGLTARQVGDLAAALDHPLDDADAERLHDHTRGNPRHVAALLHRSPPVRFDHALPLPMPPTGDYEQLARRLLAACEEGTRQLVRAGSVLGRVFSVHDSACIAGAAGGPGVGAPLEAFGQAVAAGVVVDAGGCGGTRAAFTHPLLHAAVYHGVGPALRARLHAAAARRAAERGEERMVELRHRAAAADGPDAALATELAAHAGTLGRDGAWSTGAEMLRLAADLDERAGVRARYRWEHVEYLLLAGDLARARAAAGTAPDRPCSALRPYVLGRLALTAGAQDEARSLLELAWSRGQSSAPPHPDLPSGGLLPPAGQPHLGPPHLGASQPAPPHTRPRTAEQLAWLSLMRGDGRAAVAWALRGAGSGTAGARDVLGLGLALTGQLADGLRELDPSNPHDPPLDGLLARGVLHLWDDRPAQARRLLTSAATRHRDEGIPGLGVLALGFLAEAAYRCGAWDEAVAHAHQAVTLAYDADQRWLLALAHARAAAPAAARGDTRTAREHTQAAEAHAQAPGDLAYAATARAQLHHAQGDFAAVVEALAPLTRSIPHRDGIDEPGVLPWPALLAESLARGGAPDAAARLLAVHEPLAAARSRCGAVASLARARGAMEAVRGRWAAAQEAYRRALAYVNEGEALPFEEALARLGHGAVLRRAGRPAAAVAELDAAQALFTRLGAVPYAARTAAELAACGREPPAGRVGGSSATVRLTAQQLAVARLAATGLTNRQIGRELLLSVKTIEYHLGQVYARLGVPSRTALAAALLAPAPQRSIS